MGRVRKVISDDIQAEEDFAAWWAEQTQCHMFLNESRASGSWRRSATTSCFHQTAIRSMPYLTDANADLYGWLQAVQNSDAAGVARFLEIPRGSRFGRIPRNSVGGNFRPFPQRQKFPPLFGKNAGDEGKRPSQGKMPSPQRYS